ncbi:MAG: AAA family ATPase, partial [Clostridia bacterium]|nr:AAA family ATPase [Clostridia bacterium]
KKVGLISCIGYIKNNLEKTNLFNFIESEKENEIITVLGVGGVGKSIFTLNLSNTFKEEKNKILIIDFDILNDSLHTILGVKKYSKKIKNRIKKNNLLEKINIKELIIKIDKNIDLISGVNILFDKKYKISSKKIKNILDELKKDYKYILIDTSNECFFDYTKELIINSTKSIFLVEPNLNEIKKAKKLLDFYKNNWRINKEKINIVYNKMSDISISENILENIFDEYNVIGEMKYSKYYNMLINCNMRVRKSEIEQEFKKIKNNLFERVMNYGIRKGTIK